MDDHAHIATLTRTFRDAAVPDNVNTPARLLAYGWMSTVADTADAVAVLHGQDLGHAASPLTRTVMQHAAAICWLEHEPVDAVAAAQAHLLANDEKLRGHATRTGWDLTGTAEAPTTSDIPGNPAVLDDFVQLVDKARWDPSAYVPYRLHSAHTHPSVISATRYNPGAAPAPIPLRPTVLFTAHALHAYGTIIDDPTCRAAAETIDDALGV